MSETHDRAPAGGRRRAEAPTRSARRRRRFDLTVVLAVLLPLALLAALAGVQALGSPDHTPTAVAPTRVPLPQAVAVCPSGPAPALLAQADVGGGVTPGEVATRVLPGGARQDAAVDGTEPVPVPGSGEGDGEDGPVVVAADGATAPGLLAARFPVPLAAAECQAPAFDQWFTGVGAGAEHGSTLELVNPDAGPAVVEVTVLGRRGPVEVDDLRGVRVPGDETVSVDLAEVVPRGSELALHVVTTRGRAVASVLDRQDPLGGGEVARDYLPAQAAPATDALVLAPSAGDGDDTLVLANPGDDETRVSLRAVTADAAFAPEGLDDVVLGPGAVEAVDVGEVFAGRGEEEVLGLRVASEEPVTAAVRSIVDGDLAAAVPAEPWGEPTTALVPADTAKRLLLGGATSRVTVTVTPAAADGEALEPERVELDPGRTVSLDLPDEAASLVLEPRGGRVQGVLGLSGDGVAVERLRPLQTTASVAAVRPGRG